MRLNPDATFDCLFVAQRLQATTNSFAAPEIHLFAYLACLLWLYSRRAITDWGYEFVGTELGAPFSRQIDVTLKELLDRGFFSRIQDRLRMTQIAEEELQGLARLSLHFDRIDCLKAACACMASFSVGMVTSALAEEPELKRAQSVPANRRLLEEAGRAQIYAQFEALHSALAQHGDDLRLPAVIWLGALYRSVAA
jgi:hypothetical protein